MYATYICSNIIFKFRLAVNNRFGETTLLDEKNTSKNTFLAIGPKAKETGCIFIHISKEYGKGDI